MSHLAPTENPKKQSLKGQESTCPYKSLHITSSYSHDLTDKS